MNENVATPLNPVTSLQIRCTRKIRGFAGGYGEIISRGLRVFLPFMIFIFLAVSLGSNNSSGGKSLPAVVNCTADLSNINSIRRSTNIFNGIYIVIALLAVVFEAPLFVLKMMNSNLLEQYWKFFWILELIATQVFTHAFAGGIVGSYLMTWFWTPYYNAVQMNHDSLKPAQIVLGMSWTLYGFFVGSYINFYISYTGIVSYGVRKQYGLGCGRCDNCKSLINSGVNASIK